MADARADAARYFQQHGRWGILMNSIYWLDEMINYQYRPHKYAIATHTPIHFLLLLISYWPD